MAADSKTILLPQMEYNVLPESAVWFKKQNQMFDYLKANPTSFPVAWDKTGSSKGAKIYGAFKAKEHVYPALNSLDLKDRCCYEIIPENTVARLHADIEYKVDINDPDKIDEQLAVENEIFGKKLDSYLTQLRIFLFEKTGHEPKFIVEKCGSGGTACRVKTSDSKIKTSAHLIVENLCITNSEEGRVLHKRIMTLDGETEKMYGDFIDHSVYSSNRCLRGYGMVKKDDPVPTPFVFDEHRNQDPSALSRSPEMALVTFIPETCINILDLVPSTPSLASMLAKAPMQGHKTNGSNTSKDQTKRSQSDKKDPLIASVTAACEKLLREAGDTKSKIRYRGNRNAQYDFQGMNPPGGRQCLVNPIRASLGNHVNHNFSLYVSEIPGFGSLFQVNYSCESPSCKKYSSAGTKYTGRIGILIQEGEEYHIWSVDEKRTSSKAAGSSKKEAAPPKSSQRGNEGGESGESSLVDVEQPSSAENASNQMDVEGDLRVSARMEIDGGGPNCCEGNEKNGDIREAVARGGVVNGNGSCDRRMHTRRRPRPDEDVSEERSGCDEGCGDDKSKRNRRQSDEGGRDRGLGQEGGGSGRGEGGGGDDGDDGNGGDDGDDGSGDDDEEGNDNNIGDNERSVDADQFDYILKNLNPERFEDESSLLVLCQVCNNESQIDVLRRYHNFDLHSHEWLLKEKKPGLNVHALIDWLRNDNHEAYRNILFGICAEFEYFKYVSQHKLAILYYNMNPDQYLYDNKLGWCEFNAHNILEIRKETPASLVSDISKRLGRHFEDLVSCCPDNFNADPAGSGKKTRESAVKGQMKRTCTQVGTASFVKGIADFLKWLCQVSHLTDKIDSNRNLLAFENLVFDLNLGRMRKIHPSDCITKTTRYQLDLTRNSKIEEQIKIILWTIFEDDQIIIYWWTTIALSIFGISFQSLYVHTGGGRNGKGILAGILQSALGDYFQTADNAFLTTSFDSSRPNSVLAQCHGKRLLCVSEPETGKPNCSLTVDFVKYITGSDSGINTRDLNGKAFTYNPLFTPLLLCNDKPRLNKVDAAIEERLKIIEYPFKFVDNPKLPNEKRKDNHLKTKVEAPSFINEFILMLCDIAFQNKDIEYIQLPEKVAKNISDYVDENNVIKHFIYEHYEVTHNQQDCVKASDLLTKYKHYSADQRLSAQLLKAQMTFIGFKQQSKKDANYYLGLKAKGF